MIKGINKRVIIIKNPDSEIFEEAYFIVKNKNFFRTPKESDMVGEANRLITEYHEQQAKHKDHFKNIIESRKEENLKTSLSGLKKESEKSKEIKEMNYDEGYAYETPGASVAKEYGYTGKTRDDFKLDLKSAFKLLSAKKAKKNGLELSPRSFLFGIAFMSLVVIVFKVIEMFM